MRSRVRMVLLALAVGLLATPLLGETVELWFDGMDTYDCDDPFDNQGYTCWMTATTAEDCDGGGNCSFGWAEGVVYMNGVRVMIDLTAGDPVDSVTVYYWDVMQDDLRAFLYDDTGNLVAQENGEFYGEELTVRGGGQQVATLAVSACDGELYEVLLYTSSSTAVGDAVARHVRLSPPFPNPFNPACRVAFVLERPQAVELAIFDARGRRVRTLIGGESLAAGRHQRRWDGRDDTGRAVAGGTYLARLVADDGTVVTRRLTLVR